MAVGSTTARAGLTLLPTLTAYLHAFASNLVTVALRSVPLGQTDGLRTLAALEPLILTTAERASVSTLDDLGGAALNSDIASMRHETQHSRIFIS